MTLRFPAFVLPTELQEISAVICFCPHAVLLKKWRMENCQILRALIHASMWCIMHFSSVTIKLSPLVFPLQTRKLICQIWFACLQLIFTSVYITGYLAVGMSKMAH